VKGCSAVPVRAVACCEQCMVSSSEHARVVRVSCQTVTALLNMSMDMPFAFCTDEMKT
jgi:hypothetical protein